MGLGHRDCVWNCGATDCPAPAGNFWIDRKAEAMRTIKRQPFFTPSERVKIALSELNDLETPNT